MSNKITMDGKYTTRGGREVRVLCVDRNSPEGLSVIALVNKGNGEVLESYTDTGRYYSSNITSKHDLVPKPKRIKGWMNIYLGENGSQIYPTISMANKKAVGARIACIEIDVEEGEGL